MEEKKEGCYWIALKDKRARTDCAKYVDLYKSRDLPENESLTPYIGEKCPFCGRIIFVDKESYSLVKS